MITEVIMPKAGQTMEEGTILTWLIRVGEEVKKGDKLVEVETDKAVLEVESPGSGVLRKIFYNEDDVIPVLETIAIIADADEDISSVLVETGKKTKVAGEQDAVVAQETIEGTLTAPKEIEEQPREIVQKIKAGKAIATPAARRVAREKNIDLSIVKSSDSSGRITEADVLAFAEAVAKSAEAAPKEKRVRLSPMRKAIAKNLLYSKQNIPHFYLTIEVDATQLYETYQKVKQEHNVSINDYIVKAVAITLPEFPSINSQLEEDAQVFKSEVNIGIAVALKEGLCIPVLLNADKLTLYEIADRVRTLVQNAREGKIVGTGKGTFTISNLGMFGITEFAAVINPPEVGILAVGKLCENVRVVEGKVDIGKGIKLTLSGDHRAFDGVIGSEFLSKIKNLLESPHQLIS
jgi:pyruvate dehydrogenase E2 component (dihydrolipoamide acetyltransferase)